MEALNKNTVKVVFSEKLNKAEAEKVNSYEISKVVPGTFVAAAPASATLQSDGKTVHLVFATAQEMIDSQSGYSLKINASATPANNTVADLAGNKATAAERIFDGKGTEDQIAPQLIKATYDKTTGVITLSFNKNVLRTDAAFDETKITVKGATATYVLLEADYTAAGGTTPASGVQIPLTAASKAAINALGDELKLDIAAGAVSDTNATPVKNEAITDFALASTVAPSLSTAAFDQASRQLTLTFTESDIDVSTFNVKGVTLAGSALTAKSKVLTTTNGKTVVIEVETTIAVNAASTVSLAATAVKNTAGTAVVAVTNKAITYTADTVKPTLLTANYNDGTSELTLTFSENIDVSAVTITGISLTDGTATVTLTGASTVIGTTSSKTVRIDVQDSLATVDLAKLKIVVAANAFKDLAGNGIAEIKATANFAVSYTDMKAPTAAIAAGQSSTTLVVTFNEKVNKAQAETAANYTIKAGLVTLTVKSATLSADGKTVNLVTDEQSNLTYTLSLSNIADLAGNVYVNPTTLPSVTITGAGTGDSTKPKIASATYIDNGDNEPGAGDKIKVVFDEPIATPIANVKAEAFAFGAGLTVSNATFAYGATQEEIIITLGASSTATWATPANVQIAPAGSILKDAAGNVADTTVSKTIASPGGALTIASITYIDANGDYAKSVGDTVEVKFNQAINIDSTPTAGDIFDATELGKLGLATGDAIAIKSGTTDTVVATTTLVATAAYDKTSDAIKGAAAAPGVTSKWGQDLTALGTGIAVSKYDAANAKLVAAEYNKTTGVLTLKYDKLLKYANSTDVAGELVVLSGGVPATLGGTFTTPAAAVDSQVALTVADATDKAILASGVAQVQIKAGGSSTIATNAYDAKIMPSASPVTVTVVE